MTSTLTDAIYDIVSFSLDCLLTGVDARREDPLLIL